MAHAGQTFEGQHEAIVDQEMWEAVQLQLSANYGRRAAPTNTASQALLGGLIHDETGDRLSPSHATKRGRRYRYYISHRLMREPDKHPDAWRLPASTIERAVGDALIAFLRDRDQIDSLFGEEDVLRLHGSSVAARTAKAIDLCNDGPPQSRQAWLKRVIRRIDLSQAALVITIDIEALAEELFGQAALDQGEATHRITVPIRLQRRGVERKIVLLDPATGDAASKREPAAQLCMTVASAYRWMTMLAEGRVSSIREIAQQEGLAENEISRRMPLAFLAPDIVEAILQGRQPSELTVQTLARLSPMPESWPAQRRLLGFSH